MEHKVEVLEEKLKLKESSTGEGAGSEVEALKDLKSLLRKSPGLKSKVEHLDLAEQEIDKELEDEEQEIDEETKGKREENLLKEISYLSAVAKYSHFLSKGQEKTLRGENVSILQGWVPVKELDTLKESLTAVQEEIGGEISVKIEDPTPGEEAPTVKEASPPFKAFGSLTRQYGFPTPEEIDPTPITAFLWTMMFGFMFADWGQGLTLVLLGFLLIKLETNLMGFPSKKLGKLVVGCGIFATIFGLLTGEFFLLEAGAITPNFPFHPLWPGVDKGWATEGSNIIWLIKIAIFFGITQIVIGILLSTKNHFAEGEVDEALLGEGGLAGLLAFLSLVLMAFKFLAPYGEGPVFVIVPSFLTLTSSGLSWPLLTLILGLLLIIVGATRGEGGSIGLGVGTLIEALIGFLSNMISFIRMAGFLLLHVALALVVHELMAMGLGIGVGFLVILNLFALTLEFMVVGIQALRLLFYEFFTRFFSGEGRPFREYEF